MSQVGADRPPDLVKLAATAGGWGLVTQARWPVITPTKTRWPQSRRERSKPRPPAMSTHRHR